MSERDDIAVFLFGAWYVLEHNHIEHLIEGALRLAAAHEDWRDYQTPLEMLLADIETAGLDPVIDTLIEQEHE